MSALLKGIALALTDLVSWFHWEDGQS